MIRRPVIVGSSLTGLLISKSLSNHHIEHVLIGGPRPLQVPRLGESLNGRAAISCCIREISSDWLCVAAATG